MHFIDRRERELSRIYFFIIFGLREGIQIYIFVVKLSIFLLILIGHFLLFLHEIKSVTNTSSQASQTQPKSFQQTKQYADWTLGRCSNLGKKRNIARYFLIYSRNDQPRPEIKTFVIYEGGNANKRLEYSFILRSYAKSLFGDVLLRVGQNARILLH